MRGTLKQRSKGTWTLWLDLPRGTDGKRRRQTLTVQGTKKQAEAKLAELVHQLDTGDYSQPNKSTLGVFMAQWLRDYAWPNLSPETAQVYEVITRKHLVPALGAIPLQQLTPERLQAYYSEKLANGRRDGQGGLSPRTVRHHHRLLHVALENAVKWRLIQRNPADAVDAPKYRRKEMQTFDQDGLGAFLTSVRDSEYQPLFYTFLFTGLRRAEALALRWQDVDLDFGQVSVNRSLHHLKDGSFVFQQPKTEKSRRLVALPPSAAIVLRQHRDTQRVQRLMMDQPVSDADLVFAHLDGSPLLPLTVTHAWKRLAKQAGFPHIRLHDARHSHATLMLAQGVHPKIVSERLGHSSVAITLDVYSHVLPGLQEAAARAFDDGLNGHRESAKARAAVESLVRG
jgi:integrase